MAEIEPITFPPAVLARVSPELSLQRHLAIGIRPCLRTFEEFRAVECTAGGLSRYSEESVKDSSVLGSSLVKSGNTTVICTITGGILEEDLPAEVVNEDAEAVNAIFAPEAIEEEAKEEFDSLESNAAVYPIVEVERGRIGAPTDEEMILGQRLYETLLHSGIISKESLNVRVGLRSVEEDGKVVITYFDDSEIGSELGPKRKWQYVLYAKVKVFSRSGPLFELVWYSLLQALKNTKLPRAYIDESAADIKIPVKIRGNFAAVREQYQIICDPLEHDTLILNEAALGYASNFCIIDIDEESKETVEPEDQSMEVDSRSVLLADVEGEEEEASSKKTMSIVVDSKGEELKSVTISGGVDNDQLKRAVELARLRSKQLL